MRYLFALITMTMAACGGGPAPDGSRCSGATAAGGAQCTGAVCIGLADNVQHASGICATACGSGCPSGEVCVPGFPDGNSYCLRGCNGDGDCRDGFVCAQERPGVGVCWVQLAATSGNAGGNVDCKAAGCIETMNDAQTRANDSAGQTSATQLCDCPWGAPAQSCSASPNGGANTFCCP